MIYVLVGISLLLLFFFLGRWLKRVFEYSPERLKDVRVLIKTFIEKTECGSQISIFNNNYNELLSLKKVKGVESTPHLEILFPNKNWISPHIENVKNIFRVQMGKYKMLTQQCKSPEFLLELKTAVRNGQDTKLLSEAVDKVVREVTPGQTDKIYVCYKASPKLDTITKHIEFLETHQGLLISKILKKILFKNLD